jgi:hypothetical protein
MSQLVLHAGAHAVPRSVVAEVQTPAATNTWHPIPHIDVVALVEQALTSRGLRVVSEQFGLWRDGARMFGVLELRNGQNADDYALMVGLRNSHDQSFPASGLLGSKVFVCDNLAFSGEVKFTRKHTTHILRDLPQVVDRGMERLIEVRGWQERRIEAYKNYTVNDSGAHDFFVRALDAGALPITRLPDALREWREPSHEVFQARTVWSLFNAVTEVVKGRNLTELPRRTVALHKLSDAVVGLLAPGAQQELEEVDAVIEG